MNTRKSFQASIILIAVVITAGTAGYIFIEGWGILDSLYMTVITITTIGFREVHDMSDAGRFFTVILVFFSVGAVFYALNNAARLIIEGEIKDLFGRRKLQKTISKLNGHYILCGMGRMGRIIAGELAAKGEDFVVIEREGDPECPVPECLIIKGDATRDEVLLNAGIGRARGLISVLPTDAENLYVVLSARGMNQHLTIVARAVEDGAEQKLKRAGADRVVSPYHTGGLRIAHTVLKPAVVDFLEFTTQSGNLGLEIEEIPVCQGASICGKTLSESGIDRELEVIIVAIKDTKGELRLTPKHDTVISPGETLIVIGGRPGKGQENRQPLKPGCKGSLRSH
jgi:voltage-gated potassium channel